ncbi:MBL fold metallo-hydrolase [Flavobacterium sp. 102]|uniref:MBL fold metallo-hydrolase n=1 Tax=Flavobacterium sp. 102 TaxID=2135623 RepID=UPI000EADD56C|nr:MBL fold metallo-hydrolase [Flavobacterium sp. 102]RKS00456.1 phosphoribosyl 1,2-cyclic phosphodiesterase [Flavobacterium sp. 102]
MKLKVISTGSIGNAYILSNGDEALLIEAGVNIKEIKQALDFDYSKVVGCIVSHSHGDHAKSIKDVMALGIETFASMETLVATNTFVNHKAKELRATKTHHIGNFKVMPFEVKHDVPCMGFLIEHKDCGRTLFLTDTYYCKYTFDGLNNIIIEANYSKAIIDRKYGPDSEKEFLRDRILQSHFSLENCKDMLSANDLSAVNNIVLIHLSDTNSHEKQFVDEVFELTGKNIIAAANGMNINFNKTPF